MASTGIFTSLPLHRPCQPGGGRQRRRAIVLMVSLALLGLAGCGNFDTASQTVESVETDSNQRVDRNLRGESLVSKYSAVRLRLPRGWRPVPGNELHPTAELQAYNPQKDIYVIVVGEDQTDVSASGDLSQQAQIYLQLLKGGLNQVLSRENATAVTDVNGFDAVQYDLSGEVYGTEVAYLHTTVAMNGRYYQVVVWTPKDRFADNIEDMQAIVQALRPD